MIIENASLKMDVTWMQFPRTTHFWRRGCLLPHLPVPACQSVSAVVFFMLRLRLHCCHVHQDLVRQCLFVGETGLDFAHEVQNRTTTPDFNQTFNRRRYFPALFGARHFAVDWLTKTKRFAMFLDPGRASSVADG